MTIFTGSIPILGDKLRHPGVPARAPRDLIAEAVVVRTRTLSAKPEREMKHAQAAEGLEAKTPI